VSVKQELAALMTGLAVLAAAPAVAQTWQLTVSSGGQAVSSSDLGRTPPNQITGAAATVQVTCQTAADCAKVGLQLEKNGAVALTLGRSPAGSNTFSVPAGPVRGSVMDLAVTFQGQKIDSFPVTAQSGGGTPPASPPAGDEDDSTLDAGPPPPLAQMLITPCPSISVPVGYDARRNLGAILVTPTGNVLARGVNTFDENDKLRVIVYGDARLLPLLKVERTSAFNVPTVRVVGAGLTVPQQLIAREGAGVCTTAEYLLSDFAPGEATVQISALQGTDFVPLGTIDFNVDPLYTGMLSLGAAWTKAVDPGFKLAANNSGPVIALGEEGNNELLYTLFYTPFVWGKRDLEKTIPTSRWYKRINPTVGIVPQDLQENALVGITLDLPAGFLVTFGRHFRQITVLPEDTGLTVGSPFSGTADQLPTAQSWEDSSFFAVTVDLRAILQLFTAALGSGGGGGS
jgi:hypothetical protein